jgi:hypothetical protein
VDTVGVWGFGPAGTGTVEGDMMTLVFRTYFDILPGPDNVLVLRKRCPRALTTTPYTENGVTLTLASGGGNRFGKLTPVLTGNEFCVDNRGTNLDITLATPVMAFGLWIVDGGEPVPSGDSADSRFGFTFPSSVERVAIREAGSDGGPYDPRKEEDFLGRIYTK